MPLDSSSSHSWYIANEIEPSEEMTKRQAKAPNRNVGQKEGEGKRIEKEIWLYSVTAVAVSIFLSPFTPLSVSVY